MIFTSVPSLVQSIEEVVRDVAKVVVSFERFHSAVVESLSLRLGDLGGFQGERLLSALHNYFELVVGIHFLQSLGLDPWNPDIAGEGLYVLGIHSSEDSVLSLELDHIQQFLLKILDVLLVLCGWLVH
mgnify:CR=1 FL=1